MDIAARFFEAPCENLSSICFVIPQTKIVDCAIKTAADDAERRLPMIKLRRTPILARGTTKLVYAHPLENRCLIKIVQPDFVDASGRRKTPGKKPPRWPLPLRHRRYADFAREIDDIWRSRAAGMNRSLASRL